MQATPQNTIFVLFLTLKISTFKTELIVHHVPKVLFVPHVSLLMKAEF
jgi:hypothetical protein